MQIQTRDTLYPVLCVHDQEGPYSKESQDRFTVGHSLINSPLPTSFTAYTRGNRIGLEVVCKLMHEQGDEQLVFMFDPAHNARKQHNFIRIRWMGKAAEVQNQTDEQVEGGQFHFERFRYEYEMEPLPEGFQASAVRSKGELQLRIELPLAEIGMAEDWEQSGTRRWMGFNLYREVVGGANRGIHKWSGLPTDTIVHGQGMGDLLFTRGLELNELEETIRLADADSRGLPTRWEKRSIPEELHTYITCKKQGMTVRIHKSDVERAKRNSETTAWGKTMRESILTIADYWAAKSDSELFELVPTGNPRALTVGQYYGDPLYNGNFRTLQTCLETPNEFYNPATGTWWRLGMTMTNPSTGELVTLEDPGDGFVAPEGFPNPGVRYMFAAAYRLFVLGVLMGSPYCQTLEDTEVCPETSGKKYTGAINNLAYAFALTGERRYAHKALLLIGRIAELIPYMNGNFADGTLSDSVNIAEPSTTESQWYDNFFEALDLLYDEVDACAPELAAFFSKQPDAEGVQRTVPFCVKDTVHELIPYLLYTAEIEVRRSADWSLRYIYLQLILASFMQSGKLMHRVLSEGPHSLQGKLRNLFYRDGRYAYDSFGYLEHICDQMIIMANNNYLFKEETFYPDGINMFEQKQYGFQDIINFMFRVKTGGIIPAFGDWQLDNKEPLSPERRRGLANYTPALEITFARMESARSLIGPLLAAYSEEELTAARMKVVRNTYLNHSLLLLATASDSSVYAAYASPNQDEANVGSKPFLLQNSETSLLRHGHSSADTKSVMLYGQPTAGHAHGDKLGLWIGAFGYHLLAGVGAYPFTWISPKLSGWETHSAACMVTLVDGQNQAWSYSKQLGHYEGKMLQAAGLQNDVMYPGSHAERWIWLIPAPSDLDESGDSKSLTSSDAYVLDLTYVAGGQTFDYNTAGMLSPDRLSFEGISEEQWQPMEGTLLQSMPGSSAAPLYEKPGYGWMKAQRKAVTAAPTAWTYLYDHAALKVHTVPDRANTQREIVYSLGEMGFQHMGRADWLPFVMWRDQKDDVADSIGTTSKDSKEHAATFSVVLEPYQNKPFLKSVTPLTFVSGNISGKFQPVGVEVVHKKGCRDLLISNHSRGDSAVFLDSEGRLISTDAKALMLRYQDDRLFAVEASAFTFIDALGVAERRETAFLEGTVSRAEELLGAGQIEVELDSASLGAFPDLARQPDLAGQVAFFDSLDYAKPSAYYICNPELDGNTLRFSTNISLICVNADSPFEVKKRELGIKSRRIVDGVEVLFDLKPGDRFSLSNRYSI